ncbi:hypothetical protein DTL42_07785 [Bremerella cremea]|uniref:Uncharacterized protein n=1 Tax=Bremerella cremea TaxID=1031537 RepID=A0A368KT22_9BACT|nr:hypothetical protein [Bremerella cremea]RCS52728.1 hypothetical protein DTL42_07785 [Bremerella cremea]
MIEESSLDNEQPAGMLPAASLLAILNASFLGLILLLVSYLLEYRLGSVLLAINGWFLIFGGSLLFLGIRTIWNVAITYLSLLLITFVGLIAASAVGLVSENWLMLLLPAILCALSLVLLAFPSSRRYYGFTHVN